MKIQILFLSLILSPTFSFAETTQGTILKFISPIIAATANPTANNSFSVGTARSYNPSNINIDHKFNSWGITQFGSDRQQIILKAYEKLGEYNVPAQWALAIRTQPNPVGTILAQDVEIKLMSNYTFNSDLCCINTLPFSAFDQAETSYIGVSGSINFVSNKNGTFEVGFQKAEEFGDGMVVLSGEITTVEGCWFIAGESGVSGCNL